MIGAIVEVNYVKKNEQAITAKLKNNKPNITAVARFRLLSNNG